VSFGRLRSENYRGELVPRVLGLWLIGAVVATTIVLELAALALGRSGVTGAGWASVAASALVFGAGLIDDLGPPGPRGLRNHLRALASGQVTTGILKLVVAAGAAVVVVALEPERRGAVELLGAVLIAACANVWNALDVAPGRALKAFVVVDAAVVGFVAPFAAPGVAGLLVAAPVALAWDLRERAMLGDAGANLLGFTAGLGIYLSIPDVAVPLAAGVAVSLNVLADVVSLSRLIDACAPLRWVDRLGRRHPPEASRGGGARA
jgi:UDP-GlcNAc:undecaprenyl-phosphate/decaprenyl-phosphate GlcNAc-1-phosphate transferase